MGAGAAITGFFVEDRRAVNPPAPLDDFALVDLEAMFSRRLGLDVIVENDGSAAALAESLLGVGRRYRSFAYVHLAAGLGGGIIVDGRLLRGARGNAGEVANVLPVKQMKDRPTLNLLLEMTRAAGGSAASISELLTSFDPDMPGVSAWIERVSKPLETIVYALGAILDPDAIVLGGHLPQSLAQRLIANLTTSRQMRRGTRWNLPPVLPAETTAEPTAIGAAMLQLKQHYFGSA